MGSLRFLPWPPTTQVSQKEQGDPLGQDWDQGTPSLNKFKPVSALFLQAALKAQPLRTW